MKYIAEGTEERLKSELKRLQSIFNRGLGFSLVYLPNQIRCGKDGKILSGEVQGPCILIYEEREDLAMSVLYHEFIEACYIVPLMKQCYGVMKYQEKVIAMQKELIHQLLMDHKEETVDGLSIPLGKLMSGVPAEGLYQHP